MQNRISYFDNDNYYVDCLSQETNELISKNKRLRVVSLFSGCGGMDLGFRGGFEIFGKTYAANPFDIVFANDIIERACDTYEYNFKHKIFCGDIKDINNGQIPHADIVIGGFPCQDFSLAGKRKGLNAERGKLYLEMKRVIEYCKPIAFVAENVDGIRISKTGQDTSALDVIIKDFEEIGYKVDYEVMNAADYGVPQNRVRVIIIGIRNDIENKIKYPKASYGEQAIKPWMSSEEAIDDLWDKIDKTDIANHTSKDYSKAKFYPGKNTQGNCQIKKDKPAPTIRAEHHGNIEAHYRSLDEKDPLDMSSWRRLSVRECARLQTFPDNFVFPCAASNAYKQIGNAVPPVLAWHIARALYVSLDIKQDY